MPLRKIFFYFLISLSLSARSQPLSIQWQKCYGGSDVEVFYDVLQLSDGGFLFEGISGSNDGDVSGNHGGSTDLWVVRLDANGNLQWQKCYGGSNSDYSGPLIKSTDGNFICVSATESNDGDVSGNHGAGFYDAWVVEIDSGGTLLSQKCYGGSLHDVFYDLVERIDGFILVGGTQSNDGDVSGNHHSAIGFSDVWVIKIDTSGIILWQKCFGGMQSESASKILESSDGGYVIGCSSNSNDGDINSPDGMFDFWIIKIDSNGTLQWEKSYGGSQDDMLYSMCASSDGGYILAGDTKSNDGDVSGNHNVNGTTDYWIVKIDSTGDLEWQWCYGGSKSDGAYDISNDNDGGYLLNGHSNSEDSDVTGLHNPGFGVYDMWTIKLDSAGNLKWQKCLGGSDGDYGTLCLQTPDSGYLAIGCANSIDGDVNGGGNHGNSDAWMVKLASLPDAIQSYSNLIADITAYLNNSNSVLGLNFFSNHTENVQIELLDISGRNLIHQKLNVTKGFNKQEVQINSLASGIYIIRLITEEGVISKKIFN
jgi:hypothetical protein